MIFKCNYMDSFLETPCYDMYIKKHPHGELSFIMVQTNRIMVYTLVDTNEKFQIRTVYSSDKKIYSNEKIETNRYNYSDKKDVLIDVFKIPEHIDIEKFQPRNYIKGYAHITRDEFLYKIYGKTPRENLETIRKCLTIGLPINIAGLVIESVGILFNVIEKNAHPIMLLQVIACAIGINYLHKINFRIAKDELEIENNMQKILEHQIAKFETKHDKTKEEQKYIEEESSIHYINV